MARKVVPQLTESVVLHSPCFLLPLHFCQGEDRRIVFVSATCALAFLYEVSSLREISVDHLRLLAEANTHTSPMKSTGLHTIIDGHRQTQALSHTEHR